MISFTTGLYPHQQDAYDKLKGLKVGALYMEMGTGKTRTMLEIIKHKLDRGKIDRVIWFCPCSAKTNIKQDLEKHLASGHEHFIIVGIETLSSSTRAMAYLLKYTEEHRCLLVVDESNLIKNPQAIRTENMIKLASRCNYRYILNGTPVTRDERDLFSQWYLLDWRILGYQSYWSFERNHVVFDKHVPLKVVGTKNVDYLSRKIAPYTYQVKKDECLDLPKKNYKESYFRMTSDQWEDYYDCGNYLIELLDERFPDTIYRLFNVLEMISAGFHVVIKDGDTVVKEFLDDGNPRLDELMNAVQHWPNEKIIIFCKYTKEVLSVSRALKERYGDGSTVLYYGEMSRKERDASIKNFKDDVRFFVANKSCAGYSLNLQFCSKVIYYNNDWNFGTRAQSEDRVHRIGQDKEVEYLSIIADDTLEERIINCLKNKEGLVAAFQKEVKNKQKASIKELAKSFIASKKKQQVKVYEENTDGQSI